MKKRTKRRIKQYRTDAAASIHEIASDLHDTGVIDKKTMREFDALCLTPVRNLTPGEIRSIRERAEVSQEVFAHYLNVTKSSVSKWERGEKRPEGAAMKLLVLIEKKGLEVIA